MQGLSNGTAFYEWGRRKGRKTHGNLWRWGSESGPSSPQHCPAEAAAWSITQKYAKRESSVPHRQDGNVSSFPPQPPVPASKAGRASTFSERNRVLSLS